MEASVFCLCLKRRVASAGVSGRFQNSESTAARCCASSSSWFPALPLQRQSSSQKPHNEERHLLCRAIWGSDEGRQNPQPRNSSPSGPRQRPQYPEAEARLDPQATPQNGARQTFRGRGPPPDIFDLSDDTPFDEEAFFAAGRGEPRGRQERKREVTTEDLMKQSRRIRARIQELRRQERSDFLDEVGQGLSSITSGLNPEMINGRAAMVGFVVAMVTELFTGNSVWEQISYRGGLQLVLVPLTSLVILLSSYAPGANEMEEDGLTRPSKPLGPFNSWAERINGRFAMIGFMSLIIIEAFSGHALFRIG